MNYTTNYKLPQWVETDRIQMEDFNEAMANIDTGMTANVYTVGSYTGNGVELSDGGQFIALGFRPRFVIISRGRSNYSVEAVATFMLTEHQASGAEVYAKLNETGFTVGQCSDVGSYAFKLNTEDIEYSFVAFQ